MGAPLSNDNKYLKYVPPPEIRCQIYGYIFEPDRASIVSQSERKVEGSSREGSGLNYFIDNYGHVTRLHPAQPCFMSLPRAGPGFIIVPITTPIAHFSTQIEEALLILCGRQVTLQEIERASANVDEPKKPQDSLELREHIKDAIGMVQNKLYDMHCKACFFIHDIVGVYHALVGD
ncbi:hypothetical protein RIB2604_03102300 [Aspergillus luchuensis]|uniref:Uncharacterized protein n=1 Tax=Aspergillus kawachii TaxID=1069201 RepID=A0A146FWK4_ASPKA|nr:hypothetical protein RIB2604_03102300 [Aspergillus luchuensis]